jgi:Txe/YoeB family toxin of Txe-Axe toxin-antitoxin module
MFVKNKNKIYISTKYNYIDETDGILKTKIDHIIEVIDNNPLNLKNSRLIFKNNSNKYRILNINIED